MSRVFALKKLYLSLIVILGLNVLQSQTIFKDILKGNAGAYPSYLGQTKHGFFFIAYDDSFHQNLWFSDGTLQGSNIIMKIGGSVFGGGFNTFYIDSNRILFTTTDQSLNRNLWTSDGLLEGGIKLTSFTTYPPNNEQFAKFKGRYYFSGSDSGGTGLWTTDCTPEGTYRIKYVDTLGNLGGINSFVEVDSTLYFIANSPIFGSEIWKSDGTESGTNLVMDFLPGIEAGVSYKLLKNKHNLLFLGLDSHSNMDLYSYNTLAGTISLIKDFDPNSSVTYMFSYDTLHFYYYYHNGLINTLATSGTQEGTYLLSCQDTAVTQIIAYSLIKLNNKNLLYAYTDQFGIEPYILDEDLKTFSLLKDVAPGLSSSGMPDRNFVFREDKLYYLAFNPIFGQDVWVTDGTFENTYIYHELTPNQSVTSLFEYKDKVFMFGLLDTAYGDEIYIFNPLTSVPSKYTEQHHVPYPNPLRAGGILKIDMKSQIRRLNLCDYRGKFIQEASNVSEIELNSELTAGVYVLTVETEHGVETYKILIE